MVETMTDGPLLGSNVDGSTTGETFNEALARQDAAYSPQILRIFWSGLPSASCANVKNSLGRPTLQSWKADPAAVYAHFHDAQLNAWLSCFTVPTRVTFYHEPSDNFRTPAEAEMYRKGLARFATLVKKHPNRANLIPVSVLADYILVPSAGFGDWRQWYVPAVEEVWWDCYNFREENADTADDQMMAEHQAARPSLALTQAEGRPYGIAELGYDAPANRPAFLTDLAVWARGNHVAGVTLFDSIGGLGDHRLLDAESQTAWREAIAGS